MKKKLFLLVGVVAVASIILFAAVLPSFMLPPLTHKEEIELYSPNMLLVGFYVSTEWAKVHVPPRFSVPAYTFMGIVSVRLIPGTFSFRGNVYPVFLAIAAVAVEQPGVGTSAQWGWYVAKMFCNDTRVITILRGYNIPCDYVEVDYSFQTGETANKSLVTLNDAEGNLLLSASIVWPEPTKGWDYTENYYHLVGDNLTIAHRQVQFSLFSRNAKANVTFPLNTFFFELAGINYLFNTASVTMFGSARERGEIGWLAWS